MLVFHLNPHVVTYESCSESVGEETEGASTDASILVRPPPRTGTCMRSFTQAHRDSQVGVEGQARVSRRRCAPLVLLRR